MNYTCLMMFLKLLVFGYQLGSKSMVVLVVLAPGKDEFLLFQLLIVDNLEWNINWVNVFLREYLCTEDETEHCLDQIYQKYWLFCQYPRRVFVVPSKYAATSSLSWHTQNSRSKAWDKHQKQHTYTSSEHK